jgi:hypothetical protein
MILVLIDKSVMVQDLVQLGVKTVRQLMLDDFSVQCIMGRTCLEWVPRRERRKGRNRLREEEEKGPQSWANRREYLLGFYE